ncbi:barstar family protein [Actinophytocola sp. S1-96]|uniref:Barstar family protein n=2 Tax=Actinophytocola gossypii TaxID=2812003 RepID=A0ABT2JFU8_9PSEU|nr:barstar family protein [Actinophytocola gossypii]MCT2586747.1 barstar family protein [Actinophytocola gossypii]
MEHPIDGTSIRTKAEFMTAVAEALSFPDWFGNNLDALSDCLRDLSWLPDGEHVLVWSAPEVLREADPRAYAAIDDVLRDATEPGRFRVELTPR